MQNVTIEVKDQKAIIVVDLNKNCGLSKSGKSTVIASTYGNVTIPGTNNVKLGLNVYK
jgi:predicted ATPase